MVIRRHAYTSEAMGHSKRVKHFLWIARIIRRGQLGSGRTQLIRHKRFAAGSGRCDHEPLLPASPKRNAKAG